VRRLFALVTLALALMIFLAAANQHALREYGIGLISMLRSSEHALEYFLFISPCVIYLITTIAYYKYIIRYTGEIARWSFVGFLAASFCCTQLLEASPKDWASHLLWVYVLFLTYAWWDAVMLLWLLPRAEDRSLAEADDKEIYTITSMINWPTLGGFFLMLLFVKLIEAQEPSASVTSYVNGIVAFHLVFASLVAGLNIRLTPLIRDEPPPKFPIHAAKEESADTGLHS
jgi:hypothetical protein